MKKEIENLIKQVKGAKLEYFDTFPHYSDYVDGLHVVECFPTPRAITEALEAAGQEHAPAIAINANGEATLFKAGKAGKAWGLTYTYSGGAGSSGIVRETWRCEEARAARVHAVRVVLMLGEVKKSNGHKSAELLAREGERFKQDGRAASGYNIKYGYKLDIKRWVLDASGYCLNFIRYDLQQRLNAMKYAKRRHAEELERIRKEAEKAQDQKTAEELRKLLFLEPEKNYCF